MGFFDVDDGFANVAAVGPDTRRSRLAVAARAPGFLEVGEVDQVKATGHPAALD
jgi:hypothetical protein